MHSYNVISNERLTDSTLLITLRVAERHKPLEFLPGQYAAIQFYRKGRPTPARCFSIVTSPTDQSILQFSTRIKGRYTRALSELKPGEEIKVRGPFGGFIFDYRYDKDVVFLAGGIGITPFMSMIRYATQLKGDNRIALLYSAQNQDDVPFGDQLLKLERQNPNFKLRFIISQGSTDRFVPQKAISGRLTPELLHKLLGGNYSDKTFFICGPPGFMKTMSKLLSRNGVIADNIVTEAFSQGPNKQSELLRSWPFNMYALTALGLVLATFFVTVGDLISTLPSKAAASTSSTTNPSTTTNTRQAQLDTLVNNIPPTTTTNTTTTTPDNSQQTTTDTTTTTQSPPTTTTTPTQTTPTPTTSLS